MEGIRRIYTDDRAGDGGALLSSRYTGHPVVWAHFFTETSPRAIMHSGLFLALNRSLMLYRLARGHTNWVDRDTRSTTYS